MTDKVALKIKKHPDIDKAIENNFDYICEETLASSLELVENITENNTTEVAVDNNISTILSVVKSND